VAAVLTRESRETQVWAYEGGLLAVFLNWPVSGVTLADCEDISPIDWEAFKAAIEYYSKIVAPAADAGFCYVLAATDRSVIRIREEGRFLDAPDTKQQRAEAAAAGGRLPVLVLLRQNGEKEKGWGGYPFWWPVLFAPKGARPSVFATTLREDEPRAAAQSADAVPLGTL